MGIQNKKHFRSEMPQECFCFMQDKVLETQSSFSVSSVSLSSSASGIWSLCRLVCGIVIRTEGADTICTAAGCSGSVLCGFLAVLRSLFCVGSFFRCVAETDIVIFVLVCAAASAFRQVVTVAGLVQSLVVCFFSANTVAAEAAAAAAIIAAMMVPFMSIPLFSDTLCLL